MPQSKNKKNISTISYTLTKEGRIYLYSVDLIPENKSVFKGESKTKNNERSIKAK